MLALVTAARSLSAILAIPMSSILFQMLTSKIDCCFANWVPGVQTALTHDKDVNWAKSCMPHKLGALSRAHQHQP